MLNVDNEEWIQSTKYIVLWLGWKTSGWEFDSPPLHQKVILSRASKKWEEWKKDPKLKAIAEKKEKEANAKLKRKMQFNSNIAEYEQYAKKIHEGVLGNEWKAMDEDEAGDLSVEYGYMRIIFVFVVIVSVITSGLYFFT